VITVIIVAVIVYAAFHIGAGHTHHRYRKAHSLSPNFYWSSVRGSCASVRLPGGFRVGHRLQASLARPPRRLRLAGRSVCASTATES
jgi:hypothetical protein